MSKNPSMDGQALEISNQSPTDMTEFVQNLLQQMRSRFLAMSDNIVSKIDEMGSRIDDLEKSIDNLKAEIGTEDQPSTLASDKKTEERADISA